jgi:Spy/CpxP family protein refolding chaperone
VVQRLFFNKKQTTLERRNMMKKVTLTLMAIAVGLFFTSQVFAWGPGGGPGAGRGCGYRSEGVLTKLNLTDEQKVKIEALETAHFKEVKPIQEKMFDKSLELRRLWLQANPDKDKITAAQKAVRALRDEMQDKATVMRLEIRKVLTPEQNEKLANLGWGRGPGFGPRGGMRGPGPEGFGPGHGPGLGMGACQ